MSTGKWCDCHVNGNCIYMYVDHLYMLDWTKFYKNIQHLQYSRVTMPGYGKAYQKEYRESGIKVREKLADLMVTGPSELDGLKQAITKK